MIKIAEVPEGAFVPLVRPSLPDLDELVGRGRPSFVAIYFYFSAFFFGLGASTSPVLSSGSLVRYPFVQGAVREPGLSFLG